MVYDISPDRRNCLWRTDLTLLSTHRSWKYLINCSETRLLLGQSTTTHLNLSLKKQTVCWKKHRTKVAREGCDWNETLYRKATIIYVGRCRAILEISREEKDARMAGLCSEGKRIKEKEDGEVVRLRPAKGVARTGVRGETWRSYPTLLAVLSFNNRYT